MVRYGVVENSEDILQMPATVTHAQSRQIEVPTDLGAWG